MSCSQSRFKIHILGQIAAPKIRDCFDIKRSTHIWPTEQIHIFISLHVINDPEFAIPLQNSHFKDHVIKTKSGIALM